MTIRDRKRKESRDPDPHAPFRLVALCFKRGEDVVRKMLEIWERGQAVLPLDPDLPQPALERLIDRLQPGLLMGDFGEETLRGQPVRPGTALVVATSGTTGEPKGVELSHRALQWAARASVEQLGGARGRWLCCLPLHHIAGLMVVLRARLQGGSAVIHDSFDEQAVKNQKGVGYISLVPSMLKRLLDARVDLSGYAAILLGGGPVSEELLVRAAEANGKVITTYGMTETCGGCVWDGIPLDGAEVKLAGERILIKGPMLFSGYRLRPDLTRTVLLDGWFHSADRGEFGEGGRLKVLGRLDDVIISGGKKVSTTQLEAVIAEHPSVREAAVTALPSKEWGQEVVAAVILHEGERLSLEDLRAFVSSRLPRWMAPKKLIEVRSIPRTPAGKVLRTEVAGLFSPEPS